MRAAYVPARVVTGYQGGELNPVDRIITVRQSDVTRGGRQARRG
jgi:transglutaminase-like putative cysteine protease